MKYRITLDIKNPLESKDKKLHVQAKHEYTDERSLIFLEEIILTILSSFKKADEKAFYNALAGFAAEDIDDAREFIEKELHHEN